MISSRRMTGIHSLSASFLDKVVFPEPGRPVTMMQLGLRLISAAARNWVREFSTFTPAEVPRSYRLPDPL